MIEWQPRFAAALTYGDFLERYAHANDGARWRESFERVHLAPSQTELLRSFARDMNVLCLAGAWCGDCAFQCPIFERFAQTTPRIHLRFLDRDDHSDVQRELSINGGHRVPVVVFLSEDDLEVARYGERTLAQYRHLARKQLAPPMPASEPLPPTDLLSAVAQDWLDEFERAQLLLRLSPRLRQKFGD
jgi:hypothetical protein